MTIVYVRGILSKYRHLNLPGFTDSGMRCPFWCVFAYRISGQNLNKAQSLFKSIVLSEFNTEEFLLLLAVGLVRNSLNAREWEYLSDFQVCLKIQTEFSLLKVQARLQGLAV